MYRILQGEEDYTLDSKSLALNISSGNLLIIVDGLDEIESKLKERFNFDLFIESVIALNDTYLNCSVLITSRDNKSDKLDREKVDVYQLKGFTSDLIQKYLDSRYKGKKDDISKEYKSNVLRNIGKIFIDSNQKVTPLIIRLLCELAESEKGEPQENTAGYKYFMMDEPLDKVVNQIIMRDILKQGIDITPDNYFEILKDIVFEYNCVISKRDLDELLECSLIESNPNAIRDYSDFYVSPLLKRECTSFQIKYDSLEFWIKSRFISNKINFEDKEIGEKTLALITRDCYQGGALVADIKSHTENAKVDFLHRLMQVIITKLESYPRAEESTRLRKRLSAITYLSMPTGNVDKDACTERLLSLFGKKEGGKLSYLSIYGDFFALNFNDFSVLNGYFYGYTNLSRSNIPNDKVVFLDSEFVDVDISNFGKKTISESNFENCILPDKFKSLIKSCEQTASEQIDFIQRDLRKIFKVGFRQHSFVWKTEQLYKQQCATMKHKLKLSKYIEVLIQEGFLIKESARNSSGIGFKLNSTDESCVKDFITQGISSIRIKSLIDNLRSK